jgi:DNA integrity scanning protein DisA with diadenylate cyclase activity
MEFDGLTLPLREILDIGIVALIYYYLIHLVRGTRAVAVIYGLVLLLFVFHLSDVFGLYTLNWLLTNFLGSIFLVVIILFQGDIRRPWPRWAAVPSGARPRARGDDRAAQSRP